MKKLLLGLTLLSSMSAFANEVLILAKSGQAFEIGGTRSYTYDSQCVNCSDKNTQKNKAKQSAKNEATRICVEVGAKEAIIIDYDTDVDYQSGWLLNIGAPRTYYTIATAKCVF